VEEALKMATGPSYRVAFRRRREGKTDYQMRRGLVLSGLPRLVVRGSLRNVTVQIVKAEVKGDKVIASAQSDELAKKYGWMGDAGNISAAYLTGLLCGFKAAGKEVKETILDIGLQYPSKGSRIFAALKGALDAGLTIPLDKEKLPDEKRIAGQHVAEYAKRLSSNPEAYQKQFSAQLARGLKPEELAAHFTQVREKIISSSKRAEPSREKAKAEPSSDEFEETAKEQEAEEEE
jgi:large subunit ribosomal protein L18